MAASSSCRRPRSPGSPADALHTPPLDEHILDSITRRLVLEAADVDVTAATPADLESAEEAFIASSVYEVIPVGRLEERQFAPAP